MDEVKLDAISVPLWKLWLRTVKIGRSYWLNQTIFRAKGDDPTKADCQWSSAVTERPPAFLLFKSLGYKDLITLLHDDPNVTGNTARSPRQTGHTETQSERPPNLTKTTLRGSVTCLDGVTVHPISNSETSTLPWCWFFRHVTFLRVAKSLFLRMLWALIEFVILKIRPKFQIFLLS